MALWAEGSTPSKERTDTGLDYGLMLSLSQPIKSHGGLTRGRGVTESRSVRLHWI